MTTPIPLRRTEVPHRAYCTAIYEGLHKWVVAETVRPGKEHPYVALDSSALAVLRAAVDTIRAFAVDQTVVAVLVTNEDITHFTVNAPRKVLHRLKARIGDAVPKRASTKVGPQTYIEEFTDAGPLHVQPWFEETKDKNVHRISARVYRYLPRYKSFVRVRSESSAPSLDVTLTEDDLPPHHRQELVEAAHRFQKVADRFGVGRRLRAFLAEEFRIARNWVRERFSRRREVWNPFVVEVVRARRIDMIELAHVASDVADRAISIGDEPRGLERKTMNVTPDVRALIADLAAEARREADESVQVLMDISDGGRATDAEWSVYSPARDRIQELAQTTGREVAAFLETCGLVPDAETWLTTETTALATAYEERLRGWDRDAYLAQVRRRLGKQAPLLMMQRRINAIAERPLPDDTTDPEYTLIIAAREAANLRRAASLAPPPVNEEIDMAVSLLLICATTLDRLRGDRAAEPPRDQ